MAVLTGLSVAPATAQEESSPDVTLATASIDIDAGESSVVTAQYTFDVESTGNGESSLSAVEGTMWLFPDHRIGDVSATVNGNEVSPDVTRHDRYMDLAVPVESVSDGDRVTVALEYTVQGIANKLKAPIWVPSFETAGTDRNIDMTVMLPEGTQVHGASFPKVNAQSNGGSTLQFDLVHVPGFVSVTYGDGAGSFFTIDTIATIVGLTLIGGFLGLWLAYTRGLIGNRRETNVA
ncbi:hypothetical protein ACFFQF_27155 [Haladaptatus pallidirubidus]|uniref:Uncharacterized protein n=1 Tax=Haladaptatus pallidirubidus TaxID=1008152 RepID=A0AAV3UHE8_9EURY|nr:hypothetical protein [Haladaptatus pallidirubidus]